MKNFNAKINISLRAGILDVQGKAVEQALHAIDFKSITGVRIGKYVTLSVEADNADNAREIVSQACNKLIANPIIEDYSILIEEC